MLIRKAVISDCIDIFAWRIDPLSMDMFFDSSPIKYSEHEAWFLNALEDENCFIFVGEICGDKVGVVRFHLNRDKSEAVISININPKARGRGYGKSLLLGSVRKMLNTHDIMLNAHIKSENIISQKLFEFSGFKVVSQKGNIIGYQRPRFIISTREVKADDAQILYKLLKGRHHSISHKCVPSFEEHQKFVLDNRYRCWHIIFVSCKLYGTFYIQNNNSIGLNLIYNDAAVVADLVNFINIKFTPLKEIKSDTPPYFYLNIASKNRELQQIISDFGFVCIQTSYQLE